MKFDLSNCSNFTDHKINEIYRFVVAEPNRDLAADVPPREARLGTLVLKYEHVGVEIELREDANLINRHMLEAYQSGLLTYVAPPTDYQA